MDLVRYIASVNLFFCISDILLGGSNFVDFFCKFGLVSLFQYIGFDRLGLVPKVQIRFSRFGLVYLVWKIGLGS